MSSKVIIKILKQFLTFNILVFNISLAVGECGFQLESDKSLRPNIFLKIGTNVTPLEISETDTQVFIFENQEIVAHCKTKFANPEDLYPINALPFICKDRYLNLYKGNERINYYRNPVLRCSPENWNLYEASANFVWCPFEATSFFLARPVDPQIIKYQYLAGVCYDVPNASFKSLYYKIAPTQMELEHPSNLTDFYEPVLEIKYVQQSFGPRRISELDYDNQVLRDWIKFSQYGYSSIVQNSLLVNQFNYQLGSLLDFAWWPNLRLGNWKAYEMALTKHVESQFQSYNILAGVSDLVKVPITESCYSNYSLRELSDTRQRNKIPLYVWHHLRSTTNSSDEVVVIGVNSPFFQFYMEKDVVFCPDRCHEIPWLANVSTTFRYSTMGIIFCCKTEDVISSKRLNVYPEIDNSHTEIRPISRRILNIEEQNNSS